MGSPRNPGKPKSAGKRKSGLRGGWYWLLLLVFFMTVPKS